MVVYRVRTTEYTREWGQHGNLIDHQGEQAIKKCEPHGNYNTKWSFTLPKNGCYSIRECRSGEVVVEGAGRGGRVVEGPNDGMICKGRV